MSARMLRAKRRLAAAGGAVAALVTAAGVLAYWTAGGAGSASASVATLTAPQNVSATIAGPRAVHVTWDAVTAPDGGGADGYHVERLDGSTPSSACGTSPASPTFSTSCDDVGVADGTYTYRVTAIFRSWTAPSEESNEVTVVNDPPPYVVSIARAGGFATNTSPVQWLVTFSENVTGVDASDFQLVRTGLGGTTSVTSVVPGAAVSSTTFTVTASTGPSGSGTLGLNLVDNDSIVDGTGQPLGDDTGGTNGDFTGEVFVIDRTPPTNSLSLAASPVAVGAYMGPTTLYFKRDAPGSFTLVNTVSDAHSGPASANFPAVTANNWTHPEETVATPEGGPFASSYSWAGGPGTTGSPSGGQTNFRSTDLAGNTSGTTTLTFTNDTTAPTGGALAANSTSATVAGSTSFNTSGGFTLTRTNYTDSGSGLESSILVRDEAPLVGNVCGEFANPEELVGTPAQNAGAGIASGNCYRYTLTGADRVGNAASIRTTVKVDTIGPTNLLSHVPGTGGSFLDLGNNVVFYRGGAGGSFQIRNTVADSETGPGASLTSPSLNSGGWTHTMSTVSTPTGGPYNSGTFNWTNSASSSPTVVVTGRDVAGNATAAPTLTFRRDSTAPTGGVLTVNGSSATSGAGTTTFDTDASFTIVAITHFEEAATATASGLAASTLVRTQATLSNNTCGAFSTPIPISGAAPVTQDAADGIASGDCYRYTLTGTDNVGNVASVLTTVKVDTAPPPTSISFSPASPNGTNGWYRSSAPTFTLAAVDPVSGVATRSYRIDDGATQTYTTPVSIPNGVHTITYWSTDNAGNVEEQKVSAEIKVDLVNPTNALSLAASPAPVGGYLNGLTMYFKSNAPGSFTLVNTVADAHSGAASATFPNVTASNWTHPLQTVTTPAGGPFASGYSWTAGAGTPGGTQRNFMSADLAGNTSATTQLTFTPDTTAPTGGALTVNGTAATAGGSTSLNGTGSFTIGTRTDYLADAGSGLDSSVLTRETATLTGDTCGVFGSEVTLVGAPPQSGLGHGCYRYRLTGNDRVGNTAILTTIVRVDQAGPTVTNVVLSNSGVVGQANSNDTVVITFDEVVDAPSFCSAWANGATRTISANNVVTVTIADNGADDVLTVSVTGAAGCTGGFNLGSIDLGADYVSATKTFSGNGTNGRSELTWNPSARTLTIELGSPQAPPTGGINTGVAAVVPSFVPSSALTDITGNAIGAGPFAGTSSRF